MSTLANTAKVKVYNADGHEVLHEVSLRHAINMLHREVARVREAVTGETFGPYERPTAVELVKYVYAKWRYQRTRGRLHVSKAGILRRDRRICAYCGKGGATTIDHVLPRCQGGQTTWMNCVAAHEKCNRDKGGRTPEQARMPLRYQPFLPTLNDLYPAFGSGR